MKRILAGAISLCLTAAVLAGCAAKGFDSKKNIHAVTREPGSGTRGAFTELFGLEEKQADGSKKDLIIKEAGVENNTNTILTTVQNDLYSISYCSMGSLNDNIKALQIEGISATTDNVKNGTYPIKRPFVIATKGAPEGLAKDFFDYIMSGDGQAVVEKAGYIAIDGTAAAYAGTKPEGKLVIGGSSSVSPLMEKLIEGYKALNSAADIQLQTSDSSIGMTKTIEGAYDIGMASRELKDEEKAELTDAQIALDGIAVIVNKENTLTDIAKDDVKKIYLGETKTWDGVGK